jgi:leader peptidase (prepilin peptidase)/N-methyltransferase
MPWTWVAAAVAVGASLGPLIRARILYHSVESGQPWRRDCPHCGHTLLPGRLNVLPSTGRCPACLERIGPPRFTVEALTAVVFAVLALRVDQPWPLAAYCWLAVVGVALGYVDVTVHRLPDQLTMAGFAGVLVLLGVAAVVDGEPVRVAWAAANGLGMAAAYLVLVLVYPAGMGLGDVKLALSLGTALGWLGWVATVLGTAAGFLAAGLVSLVLLVIGRVTRKTEIPHGPFMLTGTLATLVLLS